MPFALYTLKHATISENKVNKSWCRWGRYTKHGNVARVMVLMRRSQAIGLFMWTGYEDLNFRAWACKYSAVTISYFFHGFLKERQGKARKPGDHRLKEVLVLVYLFNTRDGNVFIKTSLASFLK